MPPEALDDPHATVRSMNKVTDGPSGMHFARALPLHVVPYHARAGDPTHQAAAPNPTTSVPTKYARPALHEPELGASTNDPEFSGLAYIHEPSIEVHHASLQSQRPNGSRLSCGALKKELSFNILRALAASSAC